jgi:ATP-dependent Clp protease ATP-binding subunit ClpA
MPTFSRNLEQSLHRALALANERHHEYATLEHLLLALIDDQDAAAVMRACNVELDKLRRSLTAYLESELENLVSDGNEDSKPTAGFQRVIQRAVIHVQSSGREEVTGANVLVAIFAERESHAAYFLQEQDMTRYDAVNYISHGIAKRPGMSEARPVRGSDEDTDAKGGDEAKKKGDALEAYCINLNKKAREGKIDPLIGRESEINRTIQVLCRRQKNNPLFVGEAGKLSLLTGGECAFAHAIEKLNDLFQSVAGDALGDKNNPRAVIGGRPPVGAPARARVDRSAHHPDCGSREPASGSARGHGWQSRRRRRPA